MFHSLTGTLHTVRDLDSPTVWNCRALVGSGQWHQHSLATSFATIDVCMCDCQKRRKKQCSFWFSATHSRISGQWGWGLPMGAGVSAPPLLLLLHPKPCALRILLFHSGVHSFCPILLLSFSLSLSLLLGVVIVVSFLVERVLDHTVLSRGERERETGKPSSPACTTLPASQLSIGRLEPTDEQQQHRQQQQQQWLTPNKNYYVFVRLFHVFL